MNVSMIYCFKRFLNQEMQYSYSISYVLHYFLFLNTEIYYIEANGEEDLSVEIELIYAETPSKTTIEIDGEKYEGATSRKVAKVGKFLGKFFKRK